MSSVAKQSRQLAFVDCPLPISGAFREYEALTQLTNNGALACTRASAQHTQARAHAPTRTGGGRLSSLTTDCCCAPREPASWRDQSAQLSSAQLSSAAAPYSTAGHFQL